MRRMPLVALILLFISPQSSSIAAPGDLDPSFSDDGWVRTQYGEGETELYWPRDTEDLALQEDGKIVTTGELLDGRSDWVFGGFRYVTDGSLDPDFGEGGWVDIDLDGFDYPHSVAIQDDGKILMAGEAGCPTVYLPPFCFTVLRYNSDGSLDKTFDNDGIKHTLIGPKSSVSFEVIAGHDGEIFVGGRRRDGVTNEQNNTNVLAIAKYKPDGSLDRSFSSNGKFSLDLGFGPQWIRKMAILPGGKLIAAGIGSKSFGRRRNDFTVLRLLQNGELDSSFSGDGIKYVDFGFGPSEFLEDIAVEPDGQILLAGTTAKNVDYGMRMGVTRLDTDGSIDETFGLRTIKPGRLGGYAYALALRDDGRILVGGNVFREGEDFPSDWAIASLLSNGSLDKSWGDEGFARLNFFPTSTARDKIQSMAIQGDGKILAGGTFSSSQGLARFLDE